MTGVQTCALPIFPSISAADPLNLVGFIVPGERVAAISGKYVSFRDGIAVEDGERTTALREAAAQ